MGKKKEVTKLKNAAVVEAAALGFLARKSYRKALSNAELRQKVVKEIIETEKSYLQSIECIVIDYLENFRTAFPPLLSQETINIIFGKIEDILLINRELYDALTAVPEEKVAKKIGDIFLKTAPYLKLYSEYCKNYPNAIGKLKKKLEDERFAFFCKKLRGDGSVLDLASLLIMPVQRIPRYKLLLIELLKRTDSAEPDFNDLNVALGKVSEVADHINNSIKERQNLEKLLNIQKKLTGTVPQIVVPRRAFIREGSLMKVCRKVSKRRWFMLFNDCLIYCNTVDAVGKYKFHRLLNLLHGKLKDVPDKAKLKNAFQIICKEKSFTVFADTPEEKKSWYKSLESAFKNIGQEAPPTSNNRVSKHYSYANFNTSPSQLRLVGEEETEAAPVWIPDSEAERCMACATKFTPFRRRHHCRKCGKVVCAKCSNFSYKLDNLNKTVRVCVFCFHDLTHENPNSISAIPPSESYENLSDFISNFNEAKDDEAQENRGVVKVSVKRINASERSLSLVKGKLLVPQTRKAQRRPLYNITNTTIVPTPSPTEVRKEKGEREGEVASSPDTSSATASSYPSSPDTPSAPPAPSFPDTSAAPAPDAVPIPIIVLPSLPPLPTPPLSARSRTFTSFATLPTYSPRHSPSPRGAPTGSAPQAAPHISLSGDDATASSDSPRRIGNGDRSSMDSLDSHPEGSMVDDGDDEVMGPMEGIDDSPKDHHNGMPMQIAVTN